MNLTKKTFIIIVVFAVIIPITVGLMIFFPKVAEYTLEVTS